ncbi:MAG: polysaccharide biosynthesis C-terminal domain-containing protein [Rickettsiales bacterium]
MNKVNQCYKDAVVLGVISFICFFSGYFLNVVLAKLVSKDLYGDFSVGLQTFLLVSSIMLLGTDTASKRFLSSYLSKNESHTAADYIKWNFNLVLKSSVIILVVIAIIALGMSFLHLTKIKHFSTYHIAVYVLFFAPIGAIPPLINSYLIANRNVFLSNLMNGSVAYLLILLIVYMAVGIFNNQITDNLFIFSIAAAFIILTIFEIFIFSKKLPVVFKKIFSKEKLNITSDKWQETSNRLVVNQIAFKIIGCLNIYILEIFGNKEEEVGELAAVLAIGAIITTAFNSINTMLAPLIGANYKTDRAKMQSSLTTTTYANFLTSLCLFIVVMCFGKSILGTFGKDFYSEKSYIILGIVSGAYTMFSVGRSSLSMIAYTGHEGSLIKVTIWELGILLVLGTILTKMYGIYGIAIAMFVSLLVKLVVAIHLVRSKTGYKPLGFF